MESVEDLITRGVRVVLLTGEREEGGIGVDLCSVGGEDRSQDSQRRVEWMGEDRRWTEGVKEVGVGQRLLVQREMITRDLLEKRVEDVTVREV